MSIIETTPSPVPQPECMVLFNGATFASVLDRGRVIEKAVGAIGAGGLLEIPVIVAEQDVREHDGEQVVVQVAAVKTATLFVGDGSGLVVI